MAGRNLKKDRDYITDERDVLRIARIVSESEELTEPEKEQGRLAARTLQDLFRLAADRKAAEAKAAS